MPHLTDYNLEEDFPELALSGWRPKSNPSPDYNCIAFALHDTKQIWSYGAIRVRGYYWPPGVKEDDSLKSWMQVYEIHGFRQCDNANLEEGIEKVAIYVKDGEPQHVARQLAGGTWTSKLGLEEEDIEHNTLEGLEGDKYGKVEIIMRRVRR